MFKEYNVFGESTQPFLLLLLLLLYEYNLSFDEQQSAYGDVLKCSIYFE